METTVKDFVPGTLVYRKTDSSTEDYWMSIHKGHDYLIGTTEEPIM